MLPGPRVIYQVFSKLTNKKSHLECRLKICIPRALLQSLRKWRMEPKRVCFAKLALGESHHPVRLGNVQMGQWIADLAEPENPWEAFGTLQIIRPIWKPSRELSVSDLNAQESPRRSWKNVDSDSSGLGWGLRVLPVMLPLRESARAGHVRGEAPCKREIRDSWTFFHSLCFRLS